MTWDLHEGKRVILDGNHRLVSAFRADASAPLVEFCLHAPLDPDLLPDLTHHQSASIDAALD